MNFQQFVEAGIVLILVKSLAEPTAVHIGENIWRWLDAKLGGLLPDYLHKKEHD